MAGDAARAFYSNADAFAHYEAAGRRSGEDADGLARIGEKQGDIALRLGRVDAAITAWQRALEHHAARGDVEHVAELHRKIGAGLAHKGERKQAIEHHQQGINLIKDGEPSLVLVRLYEEAAWLYMQVGDNMLAIYASEKALRLAERLDEVRAASRAHGIFGRVFGRIGDTAKAHENLRRAVELARESDAQETVIALQALAAHVEIFDGDHRAAAESYREAFELAEQIGDVPAEIELRGALGRVAMIAGDWEQARAQSDLSAELAEREGLGGKLCLAHSLRGRLFWREARWIDSELAFRDALELSRQIGWSEVSFDALYGLAATLEDRGDAPGAEEALAEALELCERAGLIVQSIQATAARTRLLAAANDPRASEAADVAEAAAANVPYPVGQAAATEARGIASAGEEARQQLQSARDAWRALERPLDAARCELLLAEGLLQSDGEGALQALERVAADYDSLGVAHLAARAREIAAAHAPSG
jgi:tetratricopeptide (TPR) repeat protein